MRRDRVRVTGPDAEAFLQGQLSQDIAAIPVGGSALSFILQPQGKVDALVEVIRAGGDEFVLETDAGWGEAVVARLSRFKLRTKADIELLAPGKGGEGAGGGEDGDGGDGGEDEDARIRRAFPKMGHEIDEKTIPAELGQDIIDRAVSFTKGCYTGQELVARIDSRGGNVPRHLRRLELASEGAPVGATVEVDGKTVGTLTSVAGDLALAFVARGVVPPADGTIRWETGSTTARIHP
ncbi:MAG: tRNA-modifying protein YgfZ [Acidimicrobiaceae bacterium]|nr:tRNA-modifying protein YgfZ [Acidimicrobiaceae bacterium]